MYKKVSVLFLTSSFLWCAAAKNSHEPKRDVSERHPAGWNEELHERDHCNHAHFREAASRGDLCMVHSFLKRTCIDVDDKDEQGQTALFLAAKQGHVAVVRALAQACVDAQTNKGSTSLMAAAHKDHPHVTRLLLIAEARSSLKNNTGLCALNYASGESYTILKQQSSWTQILRDLGARLKARLSRGRLAPRTAHLSEQELRREHLRWHDKHGYSAHGDPAFAHTCTTTSVVA
jgi:hypothetical protein